METETHVLDPRQQRVVEEIQRVATELGVDRLSRREFDEHHRLACCSTAGYQFGSWNRAVQAAGLATYESGNNNVGPKISDTELLEEIIRLHTELGKRPSQLEMARFGKYSPKPFGRWGSWSVAVDTAYERFGVPSVSQ